MSQKKRRKKKRIRPLALGVFRRDDKIFLSQGYDALLDQVFFRPIGGKIEFGERGEDALAREVMEELGASVTDLRYLGALENIFTYEGEPGHEITLIYSGRFTDAWLNRDDVIAEGKDGERLLYTARWMRLADLRHEHAPPLYPAGLLALIDDMQMGDEQSDLYARRPYPYP